MKTSFISAAVCLLTGSVYGQDNALLQKIRQVESGLVPAIYIEGQPAVAYDLEARMQHYKVPALSIAFINNGKIEWAKAYGYLGKDRQVKADTLTLFQAASISKPITGTLAFKLVEQGKLALDEDVNKYLRSWKIKASPFTAQQPITLRQLLTHTAGLSTEGFHGYEQGSPVPTTVQILNGEPPANSPAVVSIAAPGSGFRYSGGGYVVIKQLVEDVSGRPFPAVMKQLVLDPAGMSHSTFEQPLPPAFHQNAGAGHDTRGETLPGKWHTMPEMAPDGLWTTPADLARYLIELARSYKGASSKMLSPATMTQMMTAPGNRGIWQGQDAAQGWYCNGHNDGYNSEMLIFPDKGQGIVVLTNSDYGIRVSHEIIRSAAKVYQWNGFEPVKKTMLKLDAKALQAYAGRYAPENAPWHVDITVVADHLLAKLTFDGSETALFPESKEHFFSLEEGLDVQFQLGADGAVAGLQVRGMQLRKTAAGAM